MDDLHTLELAIEVLKTWEHHTPGVDWMPADRMMNTVMPLRQLLEKFLPVEGSDSNIQSREVFGYVMGIARAIVGVHER